MTYKNSYTKLIPCNREIIIHEKRPDEPEFRDFDSINIKTFTEYFQGHHFVNNFRQVWEKSSEYLKKICANSRFNKVLGATLAVAKEDLEFGNKAQFKPQQTLDQRISQTKKNTMTMKMKP